MKKNMRHFALLLLSFFLTSLTCSAQDFFITKTNDTTFCKDIGFTTNARGFICELYYEDTNGKKVEIKKRKHVPKIVQMYISRITYVTMPLKTSKPDSYYRVGKRLVNGKLKVNSYDGRETKLVYKPATTYQPVGRFRNETSGTYLFQLMMPDGRLIKINKRSNMKKIIIPYLKACPEFVSAFKGNYTMEEGPFVTMIRLYNSLCN